MFLVKEGTDGKIDRHKDRDQINYIVYERSKPYKNKFADLTTNEEEEYVTYLKNLPEKRYDKAKKLEKPLTLYYKKNMPYE